jgi:hypothetical protein
MMTPTQDNNKLQGSSEASIHGQVGRWNLKSESAWFQAFRPTLEQCAYILRDPAHPRDERFSSSSIVFVQKLALAPPRSKLPSNHGGSGLFPIFEGAAFGQPR